MAEFYYIEDDDTIADIVKNYLEQKGNSVLVFQRIAEAFDALKQHVPDLVLVDFNLPDGSGDAFCKKLRSMWRELPIMFLTVRNDTCDIISGFQNGADDYITKPFELEVLYSRILALLRRAGNTAEQFLSCGCVRIDREGMKVFVSGEEIPVSQTEYELLLTLMLNMGKTVTREQLLERIWDCNGSYVNDNTLTVTMKRLREKLHKPSCIKTIRSFGYRMEEEA